MTPMFLIALLFSTVQGQGLPGLQRMQDTACVDSDLWLANCTSDSVIAIEDIIAGAHVRSMNCPLTYRDASDKVVGECCLEKSGDCKFRIADKGFDTWHQSCSGKRLCDTAGAQADVTNSTKCGSNYVETYGNFSQYMSMYYYCINLSKIQSICEAKSTVTDDDFVRFLRSDSYLNPQPGDTDCKCSVEVDQCNAKIEIYTIHIDLPRSNVGCGQQRLTITDGALDRDLNCLNNTNKGISKMVTETSYITVRMRNSGNDDAGKFWFGFRASVPTASLVINCPAVDQIYCTSCESLPDIQNGIVSTDGGLSVGQSATYSCNRRYHIVGDVTRTCLENGTWIGNEPTCQITKCQSLDNITNGMVTIVGDPLVGQNAAYTCDVGFYLLGTTTRICQDNGTWSGSEPLCSIKDCPTLDAVSHGAVLTEQGYTVGANATYTCDPGFNLTGGGVRICLEDRSWSGSSPSCEIINCGTLKTPDGGMVEYSNGTDYQSVATFRCSNGYSLVGSDKLECLANGSWSRENPTCETKTSEPIIPGLERHRTAVCVDENKYLADCTTYRTKSVIAIEDIVAGANQAYRECPKSYRGISRPDCCSVKSDDCTFRLGGTAYGLWHDQCSGETKCKMPGAQQDVTDSTKCGKFFQEDYGSLTQYIYIDYYCIDYSDMHGICTPLAEKGSLETMQFVVSDSYLDPLDTTPTSCGCSIEVDDCYSKINIYTIHLELEKNCTYGKQSLTITDGDIVREMTCKNKSKEGISAYQTKTTYVNVQMLNPKAVAEGKFWFGFGATVASARLRINCPAEVQIRCMNCPSLSDIPNGTVLTEEVLSTGVKAYYNCSRGYNISGDTIRTCLEDGTWSGSKPVCLINDCGSLDIPPNGYIYYSSGTTYGSVAYYNCTEPYAVIGNPERMCDANGVWTGTDPDCQVNECDPLTKPANADDLIYFIGVRNHLWGMYSCIEGFSLVGSQSRECLDNRSWTGEEPKCLIKNCSNFKPPAHGSVNFPNGTTYRSVAFISCNKNFTLFGPKTRECLADGTWSDSTTTCVFRQFLPKEDLERLYICKGVTFDLMCPTGKKLILQGVQNGNKLTTSCDLPECCFYSDTDCMLPNTNTYLNTACTGKQFCNEVMLPSAESNKCGSSFPSKNQYHSVEYYCVNRLKILPMCSFESVSVEDTGRLLYIYNQEYPEGISSSDTSCSYSVEAKKCGSKINIYFIHFQLEDSSEVCTESQQVHIHDDGRRHILTCLNNTYHTITKHMTSATNYLSITLENERKINGGYFWIALEATEDTASLQINCPSVPRSYCIDCPRKVEIPNGTVSADEGFSTGKVSTYSCDLKYYLVGDADRTCLENGTWSGTEPECLPKKCPKLNPPEHGMVISDGEGLIGQFADYKCNEGYELSTNDRRECQINATWSGNEPICEIIECEMLINPIHGQKMPNTTVQFMANVTYSCDDGFQLIGDKTRTCQSDGSWSGMEPHCSEKACPKLIEPENGDVLELIEGMTPESIAVYNCSPGYILKGNIIRRCRNNYTWSGTDPICNPIGPPGPPGPFSIIAALAVSGSIVLIAVVIVAIVCCKDRLAANAKRGSSPFSIESSRPLPSTPSSSNISSNTSRFDFPPRRKRNENYTEQRSIVISDYHSINAYSEAYHPTDTRNKYKDRTSDRRKNNTSDPKVDTLGYIQFGRSDTVSMQNRGNYNPLIPQVKRESYEKPVQPPREKPIQLRSIWP